MSIDSNQENTSRQAEKVISRRELLQKGGKLSMAAAVASLFGLGKASSHAENVSQSEFAKKDQHYCCENLDPKYFNYPVTASDSRDQVVAQSQQESDFEIYGEYMNKVRTEAQKILKEDWGIADGFYIHPAIYKGDLYSVDPEGNKYIAAAATLRSWEDLSNPTPDARITLAKDAKEWTWEKMQDVLRHEIGHALGVQYADNDGRVSEHNPDHGSVMFWFADVIGRPITDLDHKAVRWSMDEYNKKHNPNPSPMPPSVQPVRPEGMKVQTTVPGISRD